MIDRSQLSQSSGSTQSDVTQTMSPGIPESRTQLTLAKKQVKFVPTNDAPAELIISNRNPLIIEERSSGVDIGGSEKSCTSSATASCSTAGETVDAVTLKNERGEWNNQKEALLSLIGMMVGYGNIWRFPLLVFQNGGGAFIIVYVLFLFLAGFPIVYLELIIGQYSSFGVVGAFANIAPVFQGLGWALALTTSIFMVYYNVLTAWSIFYLVQSLRNHVPWGSCGHEWNTDHCYFLPQYNESCPNGTVQLDYNRCFMSVSAASASFDKSQAHSAADEFFYECMYGRRAPTGGYGHLQLYLCLCLFAAWLLIVLGVIRGVHSMGMIVYFTTGYIFASILVFGIYTSTLSGADQGIAYYLTPQFEYLKTRQLWISTVTQGVFSLGAGHGINTTMASYNKFNNNCFRDALIACLFDTLASILTGFTIFSLLGFVAQRQGLSVAEVQQNFSAEGGRSLAFVIVAEGIALLTADPVWSVLFFVLFIISGISTMTGSIEVIVTGICDFKPVFIRYRVHLILAISAIGYLLGLPMCLQRGYGILEIFDIYSNTYVSVFIIICEIICCVYLYGNRKLVSNVVQMLQPARHFISKLVGPAGWLWRGTWLLSAPLILLLTRVLAAIHPESSELSNQEQLFGFMISFSPVLVIVVFGSVRIVRVLLRAQPLAALLNLFKPTPNWCPLFQRRLIIEDKKSRRRANLDLGASQDTQSMSDCTSKTCTT